MTRPRCGNDPRAQLTDRTALRDRIAEAVARLHESGGLYALDAGEDGRIADAVLAVLPAPADRYRTAWLSARNRAAVLSAEVTRRAPLLGEYAAQIANLRTMYDAATARANDLIEERDQLAADYAEERAERKVIQDKATRARAEVERLRADRAAVLREAADAVAAHPGPIPYRPQLDEAGGFWWDTRDRDAVAALLRRMADETATTETQAHVPLNEWRVEILDADEWMPASGLRRDRSQAAEQLRMASERRPLWNDGAPVRRRLVRETTTYTVEAETGAAAGARQDGAQR